MEVFMAYDTQFIRNVVLLGHSGAGKTTLAETMLFESGVINRMGKVEDGTTVSDYHDIEKEKQKSVFSSVMALDWRNYRINLIDTPGTMDYIGEVVGAVKVAATTCFVVDAEFGVEVGTDRLWQYTLKYQKPTLFVINKVDKENADFDAAVEEIKEHFGREAVVVQYPLNQGLGFNAIVDVLKMTMYKFPNEGGKPEKLPIPAAEIERANALHNELIELIAENDETLMDKYFEKGSLDEDEMREGLRLAMVKHQIFPIFCVSSVRNMGTGRLMGFIDNVAPSPMDAEGPTLPDGGKFQLDPDGKTLIYLFKDHLEQHVGDLMYFKVFSGTIKPGMDLVNHTTGNSSRIANIFTTVGGKRTEVQELKTGDIGAVVKLKDANISDTLRDKSLNIGLRPLTFPEPVYSVAIKPVKSGEEEKLMTALLAIHHEDPSLVIENSAELNQVVIHTQGEEHLSVAKYDLEERFKIQVEFSEPKIPYRETITKTVKSHHKHKKQSGGAGQYGEVYFVLEPYTEGMPATEGVNVRDTQVIELPWGGKLVFQNCIVGGVIDTRFMPAILKGIMDKMQNGPIVGGFVRDVRVSVYDGSMHSVDSNDAAFKMAALKAFKDGFLSAGPQIMEPVYDVEVLVPQEYMGDIFSDLNTRRAQIQGMDQAGSFQKIKAVVPLAELHRYATYLKSASQGKALFTKKFNRYEKVPYDVQQRIAKEAAVEMEE
jgi:elongation factor G